MKGMLSAFCLLIFLGCARDTYLRSSDGVRLAYEYQKVENAEGTAVLVHGLGSSSEEWYTLAKYLHTHGWDTVTFDLRGHGLSTEWQGGEIHYERLKAEGFLSMTQDLEAVLSLVEKKENLWLIGSSVGAGLAVYFAKQRPEIRGLVLLSLPPNFAGKLMEEEIQLLGKKPVFVAASRDDGFFSETSEKIKNQIPGSSHLLLYDEAGHGAAMIDNQKSLKKEILSWIQQETPQQKKTQEVA
ncbi:MAG: alpha/beta fold hydrolase [Candidatus Omnitrophica bacterium]|nr:alpha/beta fold hydrolase [Candidatus Omnitrophota bacterium]